MQKTAVTTPIRQETRVSHQLRPWNNFQQYAASTRFFLSLASDCGSKKPDDLCTYPMRSSGIFCRIPESQDTIVVRGFKKALCISRAYVIIFEGQLGFFKDDGTYDI